MGCDIWTYIEKKNSETGKWEQVALYRKDSEGKYEIVSPYDGRNYGLFSILAGVRGWYEPLVEPRGVPADLSDEVAKEWEENHPWCHTPTWYDLRELKLLLKALPEKSELDDDDYNQKEMLESFVRDLNTYISYAGNYWWEDEVGKYRVVLWFDN